MSEVTGSSVTSLPATIDDAWVYMAVLRSADVDFVYPSDFAGSTYAEERDIIETYQSATSTFASFCAGRYALVPSTRLSPQDVMIHGAMTSILDFYTGGSSMVEVEATSYSYILQYLASVRSEEALVTLVGQNTTAEVKRSFNLERLIGVKPDALVGLDARFIQVRKNSDSTAIRSLSDFLLHHSLITAINGNLRQDVFHFIFVEAKSGMGQPTKALLQNTTALRLGLEVYLDLFRRAKEADPANCLPMPAVTRENFGIVTSGPAWHVVVMRATVDEPVRYRTVRIWEGYMDRPHDVVHLLGILQSIMSSGKERAAAVSNWLWCLQNDKGTKCPDDVDDAPGDDGVHDNPGDEEEESRTTEDEKRSKKGKRSAPQSTTPVKSTRRKGECPHTLKQSNLVALDSSPTTFMHQTHNFPTSWEGRVSAWLHSEVPSGASSPALPCS